MITLSKSGNSVTFTFENNGHYLMNGTIDVPVNGLILVTDESEMCSFKKLDGDPFISCLYSDLGMTKAELISWYEENMVGSTGGGGGGGVTSGQVESMISSATTDFFDDVEYDSEDKAIYFYNGEDLKATIDASDFVIDGMVDNVEIQTISGASYLVIEFNTASGKEDIKIPVTSFFDASQYYTKAEVDASISAATSGMATQTWVGQQGYLTSSSLDGYVTDTDLNTALIPYVNEQTLNTALADKADTSAVTASINAAVSGKAESSAVTAVQNRLNEVDEVAARALVDLDERKADTSAVTTSINAAVSGKQDTLIAGSGITIDSANTISCTVTGGGATYTAGRGIDIDSGNTISFDLPISAGTGNLSLIFGDSYNNKATGTYAIAVGNATSATTIYGFACGNHTWVDAQSSFACGKYTVAKNEAEQASGHYNVSNTGASTSAQTLFSVGNGTSTSARHNALEIRKNGDIYCNNGTADIKLQDYLQIKVMAISQADYDALVQGGTVDANTLYVITNVVS